MGLNMIAFLDALYERQCQPLNRLDVMLAPTQGHLEVEIAMDTRVPKAAEIVLLTFDPESGEPRLSIQ
jgi:hypothetical protein